MQNKIDNFQNLLSIISALRAPNGCPWDKEQTINSILKYLIEETYEYVEAVESDETEHMVEELGDILLQVVFHAQIASESGRFNIDDVISNLSKKLVDRHPHVFGDLSLTTSAEVLEKWESQKKIEKKRDTVLDGIPKALPALLRAARLQEKSERTGFKFDSTNRAFAKIEEEILELKECLDSETSLLKKEEELGDLLFAITVWSRMNHLDPESALTKANDKFYNRFRKIENQIQSNMTQEQLLELWKKAKSDL